MPRKSRRQAVFDAGRYLETAGVTEKDCAVPQSAGDLLARRCVEVGAVSAERSVKISVNILGGEGSGGRAFEAGDFLEKDASPGSRCEWPKRRLWEL